MGRITLADNPSVEIETKVTKRARRLSLRVSKLDGRVTLTLPPGASARQAETFANSQSDWIAKALQHREMPVRVGVGVEVPVEGVSMSVVAGSGRSARIEAGRIIAPEDRAGSAVLAMLKHLARARLAAAVGGHTRALGREAAKITLRDTRSRWGSCAASGNLMFSWRLILAPPDVLDYVAAHEVAHLAHMDHSSAFWAATEALCPGYEAPRAWLRREGHGLHRYRFTGD